MKTKVKSYSIIILILVALILYILEKPTEKNTRSQHPTNKQTSQDFVKPPRNSDTTQLVVVFYNLENFFDTINDPKNRYDDEYTPNGSKHWNTKRYLTKINHLSKVFAAANPKELPDLIGVCEVENKKVLQDLVKYGVLKGYGIVHRESHDVRGIDVALLYKPSEFQPIAVKQIKIYYKPNRAARTREILEVEGLLRNHDTLYVFVNHWKSRLSRNGKNNSEYKRIAAAKCLKKAINSILKQNPNARILVMGDFNDEPTNKSLLKALDAKDTITSKKDLYNLMFAAKKQGKGTYYHNHWLMFDNIIISQSLLNHNSNLYAEGNGHVIEKKFMLYYNKHDKQWEPLRTFAGSKYLAGYSDHLPVTAVFKVKY